MAGLPRDYLDNGGTINDLQTGLQWEALGRQDDPRRGRHTATTGAIATKIAALNTTVLRHHCDWRLPDANEALSIASYDSTTSGSRRCSTRAASPGGVAVQLHRVVLLDVDEPHHRSHERVDVLGDVGGRVRGEDRARRSRRASGS
jgi:hypothetical protein